MRDLRRHAVALLLVPLLSASGAAVATAQDQAQAEALRRETVAALAALGPVIDDAEGRWRREFSGTIRSREGQPLPESQVLAEIRRARESLAEATRIEALWKDL